jgi:transposase
MDEVAPCFVGIDIAKAKLDIHLHPLDETFTVPRTAEGVAILVEHMRAPAPPLIVLEVIRWLETVAISALGIAGLPVVAVNPR